MKKYAPALIWLFYAIAAINLYAEWIGWPLLIYWSKPLLMTVLALYFWWASPKHFPAFRVAFLLALLFSILGDTLLMFVENDPASSNFFLYGLLSFLLTHLCYGYAFLKWPGSAQGFLHRQPWWIGLFIIFLVANLFFLWPDIPSALRLPVLIYSTIILSMMAACLHLQERIPSSIFLSLIIGVGLFVVSDNLIALNKFKSHQLSLPQPRLLIMLTYLGGQLLIVKGGIALLQQTRNE